MVAEPSQRSPSVEECSRGIVMRSPGAALCLWHRVLEANLCAARLADELLGRAVTISTSVRAFPLRTATTPCPTSWPRSPARSTRSGDTGAARGRPKRARHNSYQVKKPDEHSTRHVGPPINIHGLTPSIMINLSYVALALDRGTVATAALSHYAKWPNV